jgi:hypothetical protein
MVLGMSSNSTIRDGESTSPLSKVQHYARQSDRETYTAHGPLDAIPYQRKKDFAVVRAVSYRISTEVVQPRLDVGQICFRPW